MGLSSSTKRITIDSCTWYKYGTPAWIDEKGEKNLFSFLVAIGIVEVSSQADRTIILRIMSLNSKKSTRPS